MIKLGKVKPSVSELNFTSGRGNMSDGCEVDHLERSHIMRGKRSIHGMNQVGLDSTSRGERAYLARQSEGSSDVYDETHDNNHTSSHSLAKDSKPLLRFKFKRPSIESQNSPHQEEEKTTVKGQRSKRKRPSPFKEKTLFNDSEGVSQSSGDNINHENMDANWILMKLGSDAIGKRVEVHQTSDNSWLVLSLAFY